MPYNADLAERLSKLMAGRSELEPRKMFGGICFMLNGNVCLGVYKDFLILRVGPRNSAKLLRKLFAKPMDITGKPMKGWIMVSRAGWSDEKELKQMSQLALSFVETLPPKD